MLSDALHAAILRTAVEDWAGTYASTIGDPTRYIVEGHLGALVEVYGTNEVWGAVAADIAARPEVVDLPVTGPEGREARQAARAAHAAGLLADANQAFKAGHHAEALALVDEAERVDHTVQPAPGVTVARVRQVIKDMMA